jgi:Amt family ammonium transporter
MAISWKHGGKPNALGIVTGGVAGLAAITPASGFVGPLWAIVIGGCAGLICYFAMHFKNNNTSIDDSLDVFACHGVGSAWGVIATGIFSSVAINPAGANGLIFGNYDLIRSQIIAVIVTGIYAFVVTAIILKILDAKMGLRVPDNEEIEGLDITQHGEKAYV